MGKKKQMRSEVKGNVKNSIGRIAFAALAVLLQIRLDTDIDDQTVSVFFSDLSVDQPVCAGGGTQDIWETYQCRI